MAATGYNVQTTADTISFRDQTTGVASISYDHGTETLTISHDGTGAISFGDSSSDVFIGDGVSSVDLIFEVDGAVKGETDVTLTLGATDSDILIASPVATITGSQIASESWVGQQGYITTDTNTFRTVTAGGNTLGASETLAFTAGSNVSITESAGAVTINSSHPSISAASSSNNSGRTYVQDITLDSNGHVTAIATATETVTDTNTTYSAGNGLTLSSTTFKIDDPVNLSQLTESTDATSDKILLWDESASLWKYMTMDDLQDSIDTNTNTFRTVTAGGNTLGASETLAFTAGSNVSISESAGAVTINSSHPTISAASSSNNSGRTYIQDITLDSNGHVTGITTATETVTDTNTTYSAGTGITLNGTTFSLTDTNAKLNLSGGTLTGDLVVEDSEIHVGDKSNDEWTRILHTSENGYGFSWQHTNASVLVNEQGSTNQVMVLGDVDASNSYSGLFGIAHSTNGGTSWVKKLDLRGGGDLYIGPSGTSKVFHDGYHPNADTLTTARTITLGGDLSGSASFNGSSDITITAAVSDDSHNHIISNVDGLQTALDAKAPLASPSLTGTPTAPTAATSTNTTQIATTAYVKAQGYVTTDTNTTYTAGNGLALSGTTFKIDDPVNLSQLTESTDATSDKILLWDESASLWKYMTMDDLQDSIDTNTNTFRTVTAGGNTLGASETLAFTAGSNVTITESGGAVTIAATDTDTVYTHPSHTARTVDVNANSGATILSTLDISVNTLGHVTAASATTRTLTLANLGYTGATDANNYSLPLASSSTRGGVKIGFTESGKNYPVELDSSEKMFVNVPWTDTNTTYSAGNGISLSGTTFSVAAGSGLTQTSTGLSHSDTSSQASVNNSNGTVIQDITLDTYGHITAIGTNNLDGRYYTETESDARFLRSNADDTITNTLTIDHNNGGNLSYDLPSHGVYIPHPKGASHHTATNSHTGAIAIKLPTDSQSGYDMVSFHVDIYDYAGSTIGESVSLFIFGYTNGPNSWQNAGAHVVSDRTDKNYTVRFATASDRHIVYIGETTSTWNYLQITVRDFQGGYNAGHTNYTDGWDIDVNVTSFETVRVTSSDNYPVAKQLQTARNIALTGAVTGNANFDGSGNISIATTSDSWLDVGRHWSFSGLPYFNKTGGQARRLDGAFMADLATTQAASQRAQAVFGQAFNDISGYSGAGTDYSRALGASMKAGFFIQGQNSAKVIFAIGFASTSGVYADADPISNYGFGVEFRRGSGSVYEWRVFGHNGTSLSASSWSSSGITYSTDPRTIAIYSDGSGNITAYTAMYGDTNYTTITTTGGPTATSGTSTSTNFAGLRCNTNASGYVTGAYAKARVTAINFYAE